MHLTFSAKYAMLLSKQTTVSYMDLENWTPMFASISAFLFIAIKYSAVIFHFIRIFFLTFSTEYDILILEPLSTDCANRLSANATCLNGSIFMS